MTIEDLLSIFHQMGHIQYFLQYKNLSVIFRAGANPAFEEAMGSVVTLSASSHKHLLHRGLLSQQHQDKGDGDQEDPRPGDPRQGLREAGPEPPPDCPHCFPQRRRSIS